MELLDELQQVFPQTIKTMKTALANREWSNKFETKKDVSRRVIKILVKGLQPVITI